MCGALWSVVDGLGLLKATGSCWRALSKRKPDLDLLFCKTSLNSGSDLYSELILYYLLLAVLHVCSASENLAIPSGQYVLEIEIKVNFSIKKHALDPWLVMLTK